MLILVTFGFLAGVATVLSPCILPILPVVLSGVVGGKRRPYGILLGFVLSFAVFTVFATFLVKSLGLDLDLLRYIAASVLVVLGVSLFFPQLQYKLNSLIKLPQSNTNSGNGFWSGFLTGTTLGLIWAPCAGPILAAVITLAATSQIGLVSFLIVLSYALGTGLIMLIIILASRKILVKVKSLYKYLETIHKVFGILIILAGLAIATGYDRKVQTYLVDVTPSGWTTFLQSFEESDTVLQAIDDLNNKDVKMEIDNNEKTLAPELKGLETWINSEPLHLADLKGKVVLVDFWTYSCINCIRTLPHLNDWYSKYKDDGLVIIGVHSPEFAFEKNIDNVKGAVGDYGIQYPVGLDNDFLTWQAYNNRYWPAEYFIDRDGYLRHYHFGEGDYQKNEEIIRQLLSENNQMPKDDLTSVSDYQYDNRQSPETYLGYSRLKNFANTSEQKNNQSSSYELANNIATNQWSIGGDWTINDQSLESNSDSSHLLLKFNSKKVFLVIGIKSGEASIDVKLNGQHLRNEQMGDDIDSSSKVLVNKYALYNLVNSESFIEGGILDLQVPKGIELFAFTFGS